MNKSIRALPFIPGLALVMAGCGGGGGGSQAPQPPNPPVVNAPPVANAGSDQVVAPSSTVNLNGGGSSDSNGTIATYAWTQTGGTSVTIASPATAAASFTAPATAGALSFQLTVTDNGGASHSDTITVTVNAIPVANAGADQTVSAGAAVSLVGSGTDADGSIASYAWTQTAGPAVTLNSASNATATFTAPSAATTLAFNLTTTDDRGATQVDSVSVTVTAIVVIVPPNPAPNISRKPNDAIALEYGSALMFVAASGADLTYEWRRASGTVVKTGPEPFLLHTNLNTSDDDDCYYVVVSNTAGIATSEQGCLTVEEIDWIFDPSDDSEGHSVALGYGQALMKIAQIATGTFTGYAGGQMRPGFPIEFGPPENCFQGSYGGTTIDGVMVTPTTTTLPLGHHTLTEAWYGCLTDSDDTDWQTAAYMVEYDFPQTWGVGTLTFHVSERYFNGTLRATIVANNVNGHRSDDVEIIIAEDFSAGDMKANTEHSITVDRRYTDDGLAVYQAYVDFDAPLTTYDMNGNAGGISATQGSAFHVRQQFNQGDSEDPEYTTDGMMIVGTSSYELGRLEPTGSPTGWRFRVLPDPECPEGQVCFDPPPGP